MTLFVNGMSYDSGNFTIPYGYTLQQREQVLSKFSIVEERINRITGESRFIAESRGVILTINPDSIFVSGSLPKLLRIDNLTPLRFCEVNLMYECVSDLLEIPIKIIKQANLSSIDFTGDMEMLFRPNKYFEELGPYAHARMIRVPNTNSLTYKNSNQKYLFYDKKRQAKAKGYVVPPHWDAKEIMRYERRIFLKSIKSICERTKLGKPKITLLQNELFYHELVQEWKQGYYNIEKEAIPMIDFTTVKTPKDIDNMLKAQGIEHLGGIDTLMQMINKGLRVAPLGRKEYESRIRKSVKKVNSDVSICSVSPLVAEFNNKIETKAVEFIYRIQE